MIPLRDNVPSRNRPQVVYGLLAVNIVVFFLQTDAIVQHYGVKPGYLLAWLQGQPVNVYDHILTPIGIREVLRGQIQPTWMDVFPPYLASMFLHGGLFHIGSNMLFLWIFADNVEDELGHVPFLLFYLVCGVGASLIHTLFEMKSLMPTIGASGAIAGVLGGYLVRYPHARVLTLVPIFFFLHLMELPAVIFLGLWFLIQVLQGVSGTAANVAVWAHAGGFVIGAVIMLLAGRRPRPSSRPPYRDVHFEFIR